jgi:Fe-S-cluster-containing dehydrogenase component
MPKWGLAADLDACTGCGACVTACHAENNISTVGADQAARGRAKHWIRVERYWEGEFPTYASHHTDDGLNAQVYNRCIGTRYCANACPYNVRFFDFFNPSWDKPLQLQLNPDVSLREVGVMEKCTFCVQRIKAAKIQAAAEERALKDGELTTACAQSCPTGALVFGDLEDPGSAVSRLFRSPRGTRLLEDVGTKPNVAYLARMTEA